MRVKGIITRASNVKVPLTFYENFFRMGVADDRELLRGFQDACAIGRLINIVEICAGNVPPDRHSGWLGTPDFQGHV